MVWQYLSPIPVGGGGGGNFSVQMLFTCRPYVWRKGGRGRHPMGQQRQYAAHSSIERNPRSWPLRCNWLQPPSPNPLSQNSQSGQQRPICLSSLCVAVTGLPMLMGGRCRWSQGKEGALGVVSFHTVCIVHTFHMRLFIYLFFRNFLIWSFFPGVHSTVEPETS
jgi:hypothetical protein